MHLKLLLIFVVIFCSYATARIRRRSHYRKRVVPQKRVVGGVNTTIEYIGGYLVAFRDKFGFFCGGSYVDDQIVVTAAHCLRDRMNILDQVTVEGGTTYLNSPKNHRVPVAKVIVPYNYNVKTNDNDIAMVKLKRSLEGKVNVIPLCKRQYQDGDIGEVSGWGFVHNRGTKPVNQVRTVKLPIISHPECTRLYSVLNQITKSMLCAGILGERDACGLDSGGPLVIKGELCGIVSYGVKCADERFPGVYSDVKYLMPFIEKSLVTLNGK